MFVNDLMAQFNREGGFPGNSQECDLADYVSLKLTLLNLYREEEVMRRLTHTNPIILIETMDTCNQKREKQSLSISNSTTGLP